jgi:hypothetical protein
MAGLLALGASQSVWALNYADQDLLLVFRKTGGKDVVYDLGSVSNFLGHASGFTTTVTTFDKSVADAAYGDLTDGPLFSLVASTSTSASQKRVWTSVAVADAAPTQVSSSTLAAMISKVVNVGKNAKNATESNSTQNWVVDGSEKLSYTGVMTAGGTLPAGVDTIGGYVPYFIASTIEGSVRFFELQSSTVSPKPDATQIGTFTLKADGELTFVAGAGSVIEIQVPQIASVSKAGATTSVTVGTQVGVSYRLRYLAGGLTTGVTANWTPGTTVPGTGGNIVLTDDSADTTRLYVVEAFQ